MSPLSVRLTGVGGRMLRLLADLGDENSNASGTPKRTVPIFQDNVSVREVCVCVCVCD